MSQASCDGCLVIGGYFGQDAKRPTCVALACATSCFVAFSTEERPYSCLLGKNTEGLDHSMPEAS